MPWERLRARRDEDSPSAEDCTDTPLRKRAEELEELLGEVRRLQLHINECVRRLHDPRDEEDGASLNPES